MSSLPRRPRRAILAALGLAASTLIGSGGGLAPAAAGSSFTDTGDSIFQEEIEWLADAEVTRGCDVEQTLFCPGQAVTREQMASFLVRALDLPPTEEDYFVDDEDSTFHEDDINALRAAEITTGCGTDEVPGSPTLGQPIYCPTLDVTRAQMASFIARALELPDPPEGYDPFTDDEDQVFHEDDINKVAFAAITLGCNEAGDNYCPDQPVTREQMAAFIFRAFHPANAIYVSTAGSDANPGTYTAPMRTVDAALTAAADLGFTEVRIAGGTYVEGNGVDVVSDMRLLGGYNPPLWTRPRAQVTTIQGIGQALVVAGSVSDPPDVLLDRLVLQATAAGADRSAYALRALDTTIRLKAVELIGSAGAPGPNGSPPPGPAPNGSNGVAGQPGAEAPGGFCGGSDEPQGGNGGGSSVPTALGGRGGDPGSGTASGSAGRPGGTGGVGSAAGGPGTPADQGNWDTPMAYWGGNGAAGSPGSPGGAAGPGTFGATYGPASGSQGSAGAHGRGGGGGGGGGGGDAGPCNSYGGGGGGGGAGGAGGGGGAVGGSGGGSFGLYAHRSTVQIRTSRIAASDGGAGGDGAAGQVGGQGGVGGNCGGTGRGNCYGDEQDDGSNGGRGGAGGDGGSGGPGGAGRGGPSMGIVLAGGSTLDKDDATTIDIGAGGQGGASPGPGDGANGVAVPIHTP